MSRRRPRREAARAGAPPRRPAARPGGAARLAVRGIVALLLLAGVLLLARRPWRPRPAPDPLDAMPFAALGDTADARVERGEFLESLPFIRHLLRTAPPTADDEARAATTLNNAAIEVREKEGAVIPATRSSVERVALVGESIVRSTHAEEMAPTADFRSAEIASRAGQLANWGFQREAFAEFCRASEIHALDPRTAAEAHWVETMLTDPTTTLSRSAAVDPSAVLADSAGGRFPRPRTAR